MGKEVLRSQLEAAYTRHREALQSRDPRAVFSSVLMPEADRQRLRDDFEGLAEWLLAIEPPLDETTFVQARTAGSDLAGYWYVWAFPQNPDVHYVFLKVFLRVRREWRMHLTLAAEAMTYLRVRRRDELRAAAQRLLETDAAMQLRRPDDATLAAEPWPEPEVELEAEPEPEQEIPVAIVVKPTAAAATLHEAAAAGDAEAVAAFLAGGASPDAADDDGRTPLHLAAAGGHREAAECLLAAGATVDARDTEARRTPLYYAARAGQAGLVGLLLDHEAEPDGRVVVGDTPLHLAARMCRPDLAERLLAAGASRFSVDRDGHMPGDLIPEAADADGARLKLLEALRQLLRR